MRTLGFWGQRWSRLLRSHDRSWVPTTRLHKKRRHALPYPSKPRICGDKRVGVLDKNEGFWALPKVKGRDKIPTVHIRPKSTAIANMAIHLIIHGDVQIQPSHVSLLNNYVMTKVGPLPIHVKNQWLIQKVEMGSILVVTSCVSLSFDVWGRTPHKGNQTFDDTIHLKS